MIPRPRRSGRRARSAFACLSLGLVCLAVVCASGVVSCGTGDDVVTRPAPDAGSILDATTGGHPADAATDAAPRDASGAGDDEGGSPVATFSSPTVDVGHVDCGSTGMQTLTVVNGGTGRLAITATTTGSTFTVSPTDVTLDPGAMGSLAITATVPGSSTAGTQLVGSLELFTNDPAQPNVSIPLSAIPTGATVTLAAASPTTAAFPTTPPGKPASGIQFSFVNTGNATATISLGAPSDPQFSLSGTSDAGASITLDPSDSPSGSRPASGRAPGPP